MQDLATLLQVIGTFIGAVATAIAVVHKSNRKDYNNLIDSLRKERDYYLKHYCLERKQNLKLEQENANLKLKIEKLKEH